jgi:hypothetical protein
MEFKMTKKQIIGAGLAGLIAGCHFKNVPILEAGPRVEQHKALLRFRDSSVSELTGIPFKEVTVRKEISYLNQSHAACNIPFANMYSQKVAGVIAGRSIWNLETAKRYIAPPDFYDRLVDLHGNRISFECPLEDIGGNAHLVQQISTIPLPAMMSVCGIKHEHKFDFQRAPIRVTRYRLAPNTDVYQTVYFPDPVLRAFRASITGDLLIVESMTSQPREHFAWAYDPAEEIGRVTRAFGLSISDISFVDTVEQRYGKIIDIPREQREAILYELTHKFNVFSVGRFATWRNILLDDVVKDLRQIERLMTASSYGRSIVLANR